MGFWNKAQGFVAELRGDPLNNLVIPLPQKWGLLVGIARMKASWF